MAESRTGLVLPDLAGLPERLHEFPWEPLRPGVEISRLFVDEAGRTKLALLRYAPGATVPPHEHEGTEYIQVLAGAQQDERGSYPAGTLLVSPPGSRHSITSPQGCLVLAVWEAPVRFL